MANQPQGTEWMGDWSALGDQFWSAWRQGASQAAGAAPTNPAMEQWQRMMEQARGTHGGHGEMFERGVEGMRQYVDFMQNALQQVGAQAGTGFDPAQLMRGAFRSFDVRQNPVLSALRASAGHGALNVDQLLDGVKQFTEPFRQQMASGMTMPAFGQHREEIERNQALMTALAGLQEPMGLYQSEMMRAAKRGLELFELKLAERAEPGRELSSMRAVYDLWIDAAEEGYAEVALSPGFRKAYGEMANAQMRVRQLIQQQVERSTAAFGMPGRTEMDSVLRQLHDLRRRLGDAEEALANGDEKPLKATGASAKPQGAVSRNRPDAKADSIPPARAKARKQRAATRSRAASTVPFIAEAVAPQSKSLPGKTRSRKDAKSKKPAKAAKPNKSAKPKKPAEAAKPNKSSKPKKPAMTAKSNRSAGSFAERLAAARTNSRKGK